MSYSVYAPSTADESRAASGSVFITETNSLARQALRDLVSEFTPDIGEASSGVDLLAKIATPPDLLLLDLDMSFPSTQIEIVNRLKIKYPSLKITAFSRELNKVLLVYRLTKVSGCFLKSQPYDEIQMAIKAVAQGHEYCPREIVEIMRKAALSRQPQLSPREAEIFLLASKSDGEIAKLLHLSVYTVRTYMNRVKVKLSVDKRQQLAIMAA